MSLGKSWSTLSFLDVDSLHNVVLLLDAAGFMRLWKTGDRELRAKLESCPTLNFQFDSPGYLHWPQFFLDNMIHLRDIRIEYPKGLQRLPAKQVLALSPRKELHSLSLRFEQVLDPFSAPIGSLFPSLQYLRLQGETKLTKRYFPFPPLTHLHFALRYARLTAAWVALLPQTLVSLTIQTLLEVEAQTELHWPSHLTELWLRFGGTLPGLNLPQGITSLTVEGVKPFTETATILPAFWRSLPSNLESLDMFLLGPGHPELATDLPSSLTSFRLIYTGEQPRRNIYSDLGEFLRHLPRLKRLDWVPFEKLRPDIIPSLPPRLERLAVWLWTPEDLAKVSSSSVKTLSGLLLGPTDAGESTVWPSTLTELQLNGPTPLQKSALPSTLLSLSLSQFPEGFMPAHIPVGLTSLRLPKDRFTLGRLKSLPRLEQIILDPGTSSSSSSAILPRAYDPTVDFEWVQSLPVSIRTLRLSDCWIDRNFQQWLSLLHPEMRLESLEIQMSSNQEKCEAYEKMTDEVLEDSKAWNFSWPRSLRHLVLPCILFDSSCFSHLPKGLRTLKLSPMLPTKVTSASLKLLPPSIQDISFGLVEAKSWPVLRKDQQWPTEMVPHFRLSPSYK